MDFDQRWLDRLRMKPAQRAIRRIARWAGVGIDCENVSVGELSLVTRLGWVLLNHFRIDGDRNVVADNHSTVIHGGVPLHAIVLPIDFRGGVNGFALVAPGIFNRSGRAIDIQNDFLGRHRGWSDSR